MAALPIEILLGVYLGVLTGIIPAVVAWGLGFVFKYFTGVSIPALGVAVLALALAGANGGLLVLVDPTVTEAPNQVTLTSAIIVVLMISLYAHAQGDKAGERVPRHLTLRRLRDRTLSRDVVELVGGLGQVRVTPAGVVDDLEGYPPLPEELRAEITDDAWTFPADLPVSELESRLLDALRTEYDVADASVTIDQQGNATIAAAPPIGGLSRRIPPGKRAVSIRALVPTGLARGDEVTVHLEDAVVRGTVVSARSDLPVEDWPGDRSPDVTGEPESAGPAAQSPTTSGGDGRLTLAVSRSDADRLLRADRGHAVVRARGSRREFELLSLLRRTGRRFRKLTVGADAELAGGTIGDASVRDTYGVGVLAVRKPTGWTVAPRGDAEIEPADELYVVGRPEDLDRFQGAVA